MIGFYSAWPILIILGALFALAATPLFKAADSPPSPAKERIRTLDGLRGFLALAVFFHHAALYHGYIQGAPWGAPPDRLYALLGPFGVAMFFMITGFLFWGQLIAKPGEPGWRIKLYVGRVFRIGPLYLFAASLLIVGALILSGARPHEPFGRIAVEIIRWLALGATTGGSINGFARTGDLIANVTWTLRYEWMFYASLIVTAMFTRRRLTSWALPLVGLVVTMGALVACEMTGKPLAPWPFLALFCVGMLTAAAKPWVARIDFGRPLWSVVASAPIVGVLALFGTAYAPAPIALLGVAFFLIANGASLFGLLNSRPARRLGDISFGIYLLQGIVLAGAFATQGQRAFALTSGLNHWTLIGGAGVVLIAAATTAHALIELPGNRLGANFLGAIRATMNGQKASTTEIAPGGVD